MTSPHITAAAAPQTFLIPCEGKLFVYGVSKAIQGRWIQNWCVLLVLIHALEKFLRPVMLTSYLRQTTHRSFDTSALSQSSTQPWHRLVFFLKHWLPLTHKTFPWILDSGCANGTDVQPFCESSRSFAIFDSSAKNYESAHAQFLSSIRTTARVYGFWPIADSSLLITSRMLSILGERERSHWLY